MVPSDAAISKLTPVLHTVGADISKSVHIFRGGGEAFISSRPTLEAWFREQKENVKLVHCVAVMGTTEFGCWVIPHLIQSLCFSK